MTVEQYLSPLIEAFHRNANPTDANAMSKYMKDRYAFIGLKSPLRKALQKEFIAEHGYFERVRLPEVLRHLWSLPEREYQYVGLEFAQRFLKKATPADLGIIELMITEKSWWDTVDLLATHCAGSLFKNHPELISSVTEEWMNSGDMWLQRTCLLFQLKYKTNTDLELLTNFIERLNGGKEFFINKAIGWVLREYSKTDAEWTVKFIESHDLATLSEREGLKWLHNQGRL